MGKDYVECPTKERSITRFVAEKTKNNERMNQQILRI